MSLILQFLGTGPSGGRPGRGRSRRTESSLHLSGDDEDILLDVTRDFAEQARSLARIDLVLLTHAHRDACGGVPRLERWLARRHVDPIPVLAGRTTIDALRRRVRHLEHCRFATMGDGGRRRWRSWSIFAIEVPHAADCATFAWKLQREGKTVVYASDVARLTVRLGRFCAGADLLVIDGAMWGRPLFSHLTIQKALPVLARWPVRRILFTQLGKGTPPHEALDGWLRARCSRAAAAYDGLCLRL